jgi:precorrin-3B synthase
MSARGWCPSVSAPMPTGDGLLARLIVYEPVPLGKLTALCVAAEEHGNGIVEVTQRGSLQIRGLTDKSAEPFALSVAALRIGAEGGPPLVTSPLLGLDAYEPFDATTLVSALLNVFKDTRARLKSLSPKVSVLVDGGGRLHLDAINADIRLVAQSDQVFQLSLAGNASDATYVADVRLEQAPAEVARLLAMLADAGPTARARDVLADGRALGAQPSLPLVRSSAEPLGIHALKDGSRALGVALPFGHTSATVLRRVIQAAADHGATSIRPAPGRALLIIDLSQSAAEELRAFAARVEDLVVDVHDARRHVVACAGAPACASAQLSTRQLAPEVARVTQVWAGTSKVVHLAGCSKGCAHPGPAALTVVGPDRIIVNGRASDRPNVGALDTDGVGSRSTLRDTAGLLDEIERLSREL